MAVCSSAIYLVQRREMPDDSPTPVDESSLNYQIHTTFRRLERGDRLTFGGGIDDHEVVFCDPDGCMVFLWARPLTDAPYPSELGDLGECLRLTPVYEPEDASLYDPGRELMKYSPDEETPPNQIGTLTDATIRDPDDSHHRHCHIEWDASFTAPQPDQPDQEPFSDPDAIISDRIRYEDHYFEIERDPYAGPPVHNQFYLKATNYGAAHIIPFGCEDPVARIDINTTIGEVRDFLEDHMDPELRKAYEQTGKAPKHLLAADVWLPDRFKD